TVSRLHNNSQGRAGASAPALFLVGCAASRLSGGFAGRSLREKSRPAAVHRRTPMRHALILALGTALALGTVAAVAQTPAAKPAGAQPAAATYDHTKPYPTYSAPRLKIGQPDLEGFWTNTTLTKFNRPAGVTSLVYTEDQV